MFEKLSVRNLPKQIFDALEFLAVSHDRSTEGEARHAIRAWVEPTIMKQERNARRAEVSERLGRMLEQVNSFRRASNLRPSHIAHAIGEGKAEDVEDWFLGLQEPTFKQLEAISHYVGIQTKWLQHGDGSMFCVDSLTLPRDPFQAFELLMSWTTEGNEPQATLSEVCFVRELSQKGSLLIIKKSSLGHFKTYTTPYHISEEIGATGEGNLTHLFVLWELLEKPHVTGRSYSNVSSYIAKPDAYRLLWEGNTSPNYVLNTADKTPWCEDIWDSKMQSSKEYWPGWNALCRRISRCIELTPNLVAMREKINMRTTEKIVEIKGDENEYQSK